MLLRRSSVLFGIRQRCLSLTIDYEAYWLTITWRFLWLDITDCESLHTGKGDNHNSVCASAEANVFVQTVALWIAVIPQIARRCHLPVWWLLRAAIPAFATKLWADKRVTLLCPRIHIRINGLSDTSGKDTNTDADQKYDAPMPCSCVNLWLFSNYTPSGLLFSCISDSPKKWLSLA